MATELELDRMRVESVRAYVQGSHIPEPDKDVLGALLDHAYAVSNGAPDKIDAISRALSALICQLVRQEVRHPEKIHAALRVHVDGCRALHRCWWQDGLRAVGSLGVLAAVWVLRGMVGG